MKWACAVLYCHLWLVWLCGSTTPFHITLYTARFPGEFYWAQDEFYFSVQTPGSAVGIATGRSGDRIPVEARFFAHDQTGPGAHPTSCTVGTGSFPGVNRPGRGADHPPLLAPRSRMSRAIPLLPPRPLVACIGWALPLPLLRLQHVILRWIQPETVTNVHMSSWEVHGILARF
jgi:hypothetical protein